MMRLPKPAETNVTHNRRHIGSVYTAEQMRKYAAKAVAKERAACAQIVNDDRGLSDDDAIRVCRAIRARGQA